MWSFLYSWHSGRAAVTCCPVLPWFDERKWLGSQHSALVVGLGSLEAKCPHIGVPPSLSGLELITIAPQQWNKLSSLPTCSPPGGLPPESSSSCKFLQDSIFLLSELRPKPCSQKTSSTSSSISRQAASSSSASEKSWQSLCGLSI